MRLCGCHEFDAKDAEGVIEDLSVLEGGVHAHGNKILLVRGGGDGLDRCRCGQDPLLNNQVIGCVLREHHAGIKARFVREEIRQTLRQRGVGQAIESFSIWNGIKPNLKDFL